MRVPTVELLAGVPLIGPEGYEPSWDDVYDDILGEQVASHYDRDSNPISMRTWLRLRSLPFEDYCRVAQTEIGEYRVSTVWIGLDYTIPPHPPMIFETMVFKGDASDLDCIRYSTWEQAEEGHERMCDEVRLMAQLGDA